MTRATVAVLALLAVASCGGSADADDGEVEDAVKAYSSAFLTGDGAAAYAMLSERCRDSIAKAEFVGAAAAAAELYGDLEPQDIEVEVDGDKATASYSYSSPAIDQTDEPWVLESDTWVNDDC